jgi:hypothetical protein
MKVFTAAARTTHTYVAYTGGCNNLGLSVRLKNMVPEDQNPVCTECKESYEYLWYVSYFGSFNWRGHVERIGRLQLRERAVFSMCGRHIVSPSDINKQGQSHAKVRQYHRLKLSVISERYGRLLRIWSCIFSYLELWPVRIY